MMNQISFFDASERLKINKPVRLIELFSGIGSQAKALELIGAEFEHYRICEKDKYAVTSYNAIHGTNFVDSDITQLTGKDLNVVDTDKYQYILTYSFPCQDLSICGLKGGMEQGTRSGLLWEVQRLLKECDELPQILLMENVPLIANDKNKPLFYKWIDFLEELGYTSKWQILNSKHFGVPQSRERCIMVSWLGDYYYDFPNGYPSRRILRDILQPDYEIDEKYLLSSERIQFIENQIAFDPTEPKLIGGYGEKTSNNGTQWFQQNRFYSVDAVAMCHCANIAGGSYKYYIEGSQTPYRYLTPKECWRLMSFDDEDFDKARKALDDKYFKGNGKADAQLYKQAGNSIVVKVLCEIFKKML